MSIAPHPALNGLLMRGRLLGTVVLLALGVLAPSVQGAPGEKVQVCHRSTGNPTAVKIITVDASLVETHLAHGDTLVQQEVCDGVDNNCDGIIDNHLCDLGNCSAGSDDCFVQSVNICLGGTVTCSATSIAEACEQCRVGCDSALQGCASTCQSTALTCQFNCGFDLGCIQNCQNAGLLCGSNCSNVYNSCQMACNP
jgi:hypothetical protein